MNSSHVLYMEYLKGTVCSEDLNLEGITSFGNGSSILSQYSSEKARFGLIVTTVSVICVLLNCYTILVICQPKKIRPVNYLIANFSIVSILSSIVGILYFGDQADVLKGVWRCRLLSYVRNAIINLLSLNVLGISYERVQSLRPTFVKILVSRMIACIWIIGSLCAVPSLFTSIYVQTTNKTASCMAMPIFGNSTLEIILEVFHFLLFHWAVCCFMLFELYQVRSKIKYLYIFKAIPHYRMKEKVQRVRFVYIFSIVFVFLWMPCGAALSFYKTSRRTSPAPTTNRFASLVLGVVTIVFYTFILLCPLIILWSNTGLGKVLPLLQCCQSSESRTVQDDKCSGISCRGGTTVEKSRNTNELYEVRVEAEALPIARKDDEHQQNDKLPHNNYCKSDEVQQIEPISQQRSSQEPVISARSLSNDSELHTEAASINIYKVTFV